MNSTKNDLNVCFVNKSEENLQSIERIDSNIDLIIKNRNEFPYDNCSGDGLNQDLRQLRHFYESFEMSGNQWFVCKYSDCQQMERQETDIIEHLSQHLNQTNAEEIEMKPNIDFNDNEVDLPNNGLFDRNSDLNAINKSSKESAEDSKAIDGCIDSFELLMPYIDSRVVDGKERLICKWNDCRFESNQRSHISKHVLSRHLSPKSADTYDESKYWDKIMNSNKNWLKKSQTKSTSSQPLPPPPALQPLPPLPQPPILTPFVMDSTPNPNLYNQMFIDDKQWLERMTSMASLQSISSQMSGKSSDSNGLNDSSEERDLLLKNHLNISNNEENILLSCKGLASMSKVRDFYESQVINGEKFFLCKWSRCEFKTKKSQKIAQHINLSHIGVEFKCNKPNCNKVFKNPNTYREHQKNHICGFGIFGYGSKGVIGVCRNESLNQWRERVIIDSKKFYRCKWNACSAITRYHMAMKRHIHNHLCPYRVNLKLKQNQDVINDIKSETWNLDLGLGSIPSTSGPNVTENKTYQCRRTKCRATFANSADLLKHENILCKFIKTSNNLNPNHKPIDLKAMDKSNPTISMEEMRGNGVKPNEQIERKVRDPQNNVNLNLELMESVDKFFSTKLMNGVEYHLCVWKDCKFTSKVLHKTVDHIQTKHFGIDSQLNIGSNFGTNFVQNSAKRIRSSTESPETDSSKENSSKKSKTVEIIVNEINPSMIVRTVGDLSGSSGAQFPTFEANEAHNELSFVCEIDNCGKQFRSGNALNHHKVNHICGFNIKGRKSSGVCDLNNVRKYREQLAIGERLVYSCTLCGKSFDNPSIVLSHIHSHICPNRLPATVPQSNAFNQSVVQTIIETNRRKSNPSKCYRSAIDVNPIEVIEL